MRRWIVVLEWEVGSGVPIGSDAEPVRVLLREFHDCSPVALCAVDRYALQVEITADDPLEALSRAVARHRDAADRARLFGWSMARAEIVTLKEMEQEWVDHEPKIPDEGWRGEPNDPTAKAESALASATCRHQASDILCRMVRELGGGVVAARLEDVWTIPVDISFGDSEPLLAVAEPWSQARIRLELVLPRLVELARRCTLDEAGCACHSAPHGGRDGP